MASSLQSISEKKESNEAKYVGITVEQWQNLMDKIDE